jgi:hypothetical protein
VQLGTAIDEYLRVRRAIVARATIKNDRTVLYEFARAVGSGRQVHRLQRRHVETWLESAADLAAASVRHRRLSPFAIASSAICCRFGSLVVYTFNPPLSMGKASEIDAALRAVRATHATDDQGGPMIYREEELAHTPCVRPRLASIERWASWRL